MVFSLSFYHFPSIEALPTSSDPRPGLRLAVRWLVLYPHFYPSKYPCLEWSNQSRSCTFLGILTFKNYPWWSYHDQRIQCPCKRTNSVLALFVEEFYLRTPCGTRYGSSRRTKELCCKRKRLSDCSRMIVEPKTTVDEEWSLGRKPGTMSGSRRPNPLSRSMKACHEKRWSWNLIEFWKALKNILLNIEFLRSVLAHGNICGELARSVEIKSSRPFGKPPQLSLRAGSRHQD